MRRSKHTYNYDHIIDLHGKNLDESLFILEKTLYSGKFKSIMIIHGHGEGVLRNGIRKFLSESSYIKDTFYGEDINIQGGSGVTIVYV